MSDSSVLQEIHVLLSRVEAPPEVGIPAGVDDTQVSAFESRVGFRLPPEQAAFLTVSNAPCVGPGGIFGLPPAPEHLRIEPVYDSHPTWRERKWVPVAGDGCGNYYVAIPQGERWPVVFVEDPSAPEFIVASGVLAFIRLLLKKELGATTWPFDREAVLAEDTAILDYENRFALPWEEKSPTRF